MGKRNVRRIKEPRYNNEKRRFAAGWNGCPESELYIRKERVRILRRGGASARKVSRIAGK